MGCPPIDSGKRRGWPPGLSTIGNGSCNDDEACSGAGANSGSSSIGNRSCNAFNACDGNQVIGNNKNNN